MMPWKKLLAYITGSVDEELLLRNEYLVAENRILRGRLKGSLRLSDDEILFGERSLGRSIAEFVSQCHEERNHRYDAARGSVDCSNPTIGGPHGYFGPTRPQDPQPANSPDYDPGGKSTAFAILNESHANL